MEIKPNPDHFTITATKEELRELYRLVRGNGVLMTTKWEVELAKILYPRPELGGNKFHHIACPCKECR